MNEELQNLYKAAHRAKAGNHAETAAWYYDRILVRDPLSWEAYFYTAYFRVCQNSIEKIVQAVKNRMNATLYLIKAHVQGETEQLQAVQEVGAQCSAMAVTLFKTAVEEFPEEINRYWTSLAGEILYILRYEIWGVFSDCRSLYEAIVNTYRSSAEISAGFRFFGIEMDYARVEIPSAMLFCDPGRC